MVPPRRNYNQNCPIARGLDVLGERWTLLILRELVGGPRRYGDLRDELPGIATNLLAERLKELQDAGLVDRADLPAPIGRTVYTLSDMGWQRVLPILQSIAWFGAGPAGSDRRWPGIAVERVPGRNPAGLQPGQRGRFGDDLPCRDRRSPFRVRRNARPPGRRSRRAFGNDHRQRGRSRHRPSWGKRSQAQGGAAAHQLRRRPRDTSTRCVRRFRLLASPRHR